MGYCDEQMYEKRKFEKIFLGFDLSMLENVVDDENDSPEDDPTMI